MYERCDARALIIELYLVSNATSNAQTSHTQPSGCKGERAANWNALRGSSGEQ